MLEMFEKRQNLDHNLSFQTDFVVSEKRLKFR